MAVSNLYVPTEKHPPPFTIGTASLTSGAGSPEGVVSGSPGDGYVDTATGNFYGKTGTGKTGWVLASVGSGGTTQVYAGAFTNPNGNVTPTDQTKGAIYTQNGAANNNVWRWDTTDLVWYQSINA